MVRRSTRNRGTGSGGASAAEEEEEAAAAPAAAPAERSVAAHVRDRQRAVAEREAARLARPEKRRTKQLGHADKKKSAVSSTPFGLFSQKGGADEVKIIDGLRTSDWCGPFSIARQMIAKREEAKRQRELEEEEEAAGGGEGGTRQESHPLDQVMLELEMERKRKAHPSLQWKGTLEDNNNTTKSATNLYSKRQKRVDLRSKGRSKVGSLFDLCVQYLVDNFEYVENLGTTIDNSIRTSIAKQLVACSKLNNETFPALAEEGIESLELVDCAEITQANMAERLEKLIPNGLKYLVLDQSGRCMGPSTVQSIVKCLKQNEKEKEKSKATTKTASAKKITNPFELMASSTAPSLHALSIGGAYLLKDEDAAELIAAAAPTGLSSIEFKACPLLNELTLYSIRDNFSNNSTNSQLLELSLEDLTGLQSEHLQALTTIPDALQHLQSLSLRRVTGLDDDIVTRLLENSTNSLTGLDLSENYDLTDQILAAIRQYCSRHLRVLRLSGLKQLTAQGLEATFMHVVTEEAPTNDTEAMTKTTATPTSSTPPPMLKTLDLANCDYEAITDEVLYQVCMAASSTASTLNASAKDDPSSTPPLASPTTVGLTGKNTDNSTGLVSLNIQGSTLVTDVGMEHLVATSSQTLQELNVSFCTKITDQGLGYLVDNCGKQLSKIHIWGNAQISDNFLDGNQRVNDPDLEIVGAWMKKQGSVTMR